MGIRVLPRKPKTKPKTKPKSKSFTKDLVYTKHGRGVKKGLKKT
jgi:hypothetical protein